MPPLVRNLPGGCQDRLHSAQWTYLAGVESVAACCRLRMNRSEIRIDGVSGTRMREKSRELRMVSIASSLTAQHGSRQQRLAPQCNQPLRIEVAWMDSPKAHVNLTAKPLFSGRALRHVTWRLYLSRSAAT